MIDTTALKPGQIVRLQAAFGEQIVRRVVAVQGDWPRPDVVLVTREDEWQAARAEGYEPLAVGFRLTDVLEVVEGTPAPEGEPSR